MCIKRFALVLAFLAWMSTSAQAVNEDKLKLIQNITSIDDVDLIYQIFSEDTAIAESPSSRSLDASTGRKKQQKSPMQSIMPMFIVPFLVQSAIIPIMLSVLKFMLLASFTVGKLALIFSAANALKNANRSEPERMTYAHSGHWR